ncbi:MAG: AAA family ATPase [Rhodobacteraceae bacterium]|nr:AAA family ATPase [Paracoccaceae bacterium]
MCPKDTEGRHRERIRAVRSSLAAGLIGHETLIERLLIAALVGGHVLIEGAPGLAKTRAVNWLARSVHGSFARVQCTPDLMPADLTGTAVFRPDTGGFEFVRGPVFHNIVLVDEINRAPPKVQSALLEAMAEGQVTSGGETHPLPDPFLAVATQNPIEHEGTYPLPEAQLDRFLFHVALQLPGAEDERRILDLVEAETAHAPQVEGIALDALLAARKDAMAVHLSPVLRDYIVRLVMATRDPGLADAVEYAVSPRGSLALAAASKARAWLDGRDHAVPEDVDVLAGDALAHRLVLTWAARAEGRTARALIAQIVERTDAL